jgi:hypothetical protein
MDKKNNGRRAISKTVIVCLLPLSLIGCMDVEYRYDVPVTQADCETGMIFRSGGSAIVDRSGGSAIRDRDGNTVDAFCEEADCPGGSWSSEPPEIDWHLTKGDRVIANRTCLAP